MLFLASCSFAFQKTTLCMRIELSKFSLASRPSFERLCACENGLPIVNCESLAIKRKKEIYVNTSYCLYSTRKQWKVVITHTRYLHLCMYRVLALVRILSIWTSASTRYLHKCKYRVLAFLPLSPLFRLSSMTDKLARYENVGFHKVLPGSPWDALGWMDWLSTIR